MRALPSRQRGAATLLITVVLLFAMTLMAATFPTATSCSNSAAPPTSCARPRPSKPRSRRQVEPVTCSTSANASAPLPARHSHGATQLSRHSACATTPPTACSNQPGTTPASPAFCSRELRAVPPDGPAVARRTVCPRCRHPPARMRIAFTVRIRRGRAAGHGAPEGSPAARAPQHLHEHDAAAHVRCCSASSAV